MNFPSLRYAMLGMCVLFGAPVSAQKLSTQSFDVEVPILLNVTAPSESATITHDETDSQQVFPAQRWLFSGNPPNGMNIEFAVESGFANTDAPSSKVDAKLHLSVVTDNGGEFTPTDSYDTTNISAGNQTAVVSVASDGPGNAEIDLTVTFMTGAFVNLREGTYALTVVGTISAL